MSAREIKSLPLSSLARYCELHVRFILILILIHAFTDKPTCEFGYCHLHYPRHILHLLPTRHEESAELTVGLQLLFCTEMRYNRLQHRPDCDVVLADQRRVVDVGKETHEESGAVTRMRMSWSVRGKQG